MQEAMKNMKASPQAAKALLRFGAVWGWGAPRGERMAFVAFLWVSSFFLKFAGVFFVFVLPY